MGAVGTAVPYTPMAAERNLPQPDLAAAYRLGLGTCLNRKLLPLAPLGAVRLVLAAPEAATPQVRRMLEDQLGPVSFILHPGPRIEARLLALAGGG